MNGSTEALGRSIAGRRTIISNGAFGALLVVFVDLMFFSALWSSYSVIKRGRDIGDLWGVAQLPVTATAFNTGVLLLSGAFLLLAGRALSGHKDVPRAREHLLRAVVLGVFFAVFQGYLALRLIGAGLTMFSSIFGACFFLMVGAHFLHVLVGSFAMGVYYFRGSDDRIEPTALKALTIFWLFVVGVWPVLYAQIYF